MFAVSKVATGAILAVFVAVALLLAACGGEEDSLETVHGKVTDVQTRSLTEIESFSLRDEDGETWLFAIEGPLEITPSHLRQHMLDGDAVSVQFERRGASLIAVSVSDYR